MPTLGQMNTLNVIGKVASGLRLDGGELQEIFLPAWQAPGYVEVGGTLDVFLYQDANDTIVATTSRPRALVGECALLKVISVGKFGAFLDWGLDRDLLLPHSEQACPVAEGNSYVVYVFKDNRNGRIAATTRLHCHLEESSGPYKKGEQVDLLIAAKTRLGYKAVINGAYLGLIHATDLGQPLNLGDRMKGRIRDVRDDGKVDLGINTLDGETRDELEQTILGKLNENNGRLELSDKSSPEAVFKTFRVSKKNFKRALGSLYKKRLIKIEPTFIELVSPPRLRAFGISKRK